MEQGQNERGRLAGAVWARPTTSRPSKMAGMAFFWMGVVTT
jgi:hypothetical protein